MRIVLSLLLAVLLTWSAGASAQVCTWDSTKISKTGTYFLVPKPAEFDILSRDAIEVFDSLASQRTSSFTCQFSRIAEARPKEDRGLFNAFFRERSCVNTKTQVAWDPWDFPYMTRSGEPAKKGEGSYLQPGTWDFVILDNHGIRHGFGLGPWNPGALYRSVQRSEATQRGRGGEYLESGRAGGEYRQRFEGDCSKSDQGVLYTVTVLSYPQSIQNPAPRIPFVLVARESEGPYLPAVPSEAMAPAF